jgi:hypothetical protein
MTTPKPADKTTRHRTDYLSLIFGLLFLAAAGWWAAAHFLDWTIVMRLPDAGWVLAVGLILLGLIGIVASLRRDRGDAADGVGDVTDGGGPPVGERSREGDPLAAGGPGPEPDRPTVGDPGDQPTAGDPGGHRPE